MPISGEATKEKSCALWGTACFRMVTVPQLVTRTSMGRMKSFICEVNEVEERLFTMPRPKLTQEVSSKTPAAVRSMAASPKVRGHREEPSLGASTACVALTAPSANPVRGTMGPQQGPDAADSQGPVSVQRERPSCTELAPPLKP